MREDTNWLGKCLGFSFCRPSLSGILQPQPRIVEVVELVVVLVIVVKLVVVVVVVELVIEKARPDGILPSLPRIVVVVKLEETFANWLCLCFRFWFCQTSSL